MPPELRARRRPGQNREQLLQAGLIEFGLLGYWGAATSQIALRAQVPQPHVYANFASKQELFLTCLTVAINTLLDHDDEDLERVRFVTRESARAGLGNGDGDGAECDGVMGDSASTAEAASSRSVFSEADAARPALAGTYAARLVFQSVAASSAPELAVEVREQLFRLQAAWGERGFWTCVAQGGASVLQQVAPVAPAAPAASSPPQ